MLSDIFNDLDIKKYINKVLNSFHICEFPGYFAEATKQFMNKNGLKCNYMI